MREQSYYADHAWLPCGWAEAVRLDVGDGMLRRVAAESARDDAQHVGRFVLPGMVNLHSHAFQRAMAGLTERRGLDARMASSTDARSNATAAGGDQDNFWTWRETMYRFAGRIGPDELRAIAAQLYVEMLKAGYTQVCEFHYLHHAPDGKPYADAAAMSLALIEAAQETGIGLTLLPVLYMTGGFDGRPLSERQRRFGFDVDGYLALLQRLQGMQHSKLRSGVAFHSLRAVPEDAMRRVLDAGETASMPLHIHIAEQIGEVQDCLALRNARPVEWLLDHAAVDARWCLIHATHMTADEIARLAKTAAVAGLCPTTEANLGDGIFPLRAWLEADGRFGIGSDSHVSVSPIEELRWLEYAQRLQSRHRNVAAPGEGDSVGETLWGDALFGGAQAAGVATSQLESADAAGAKRADLLVLDHDAVQFAARDVDALLDTFLFAGNANPVRHVMADGDWVVRDFVHRDEQRIAARYRRTVERLARTD